MSRSETMLVTGGAGFIGCNFVRQALRGVRQALRGVRQAPKGVRQAPKGPIARLVVLDKLTYAGNVENLADVASDPRFSFVEGDIADRALVASLFESVRPTSVVNFAAETHVDRSIDTPRPFVETNVVGVFELLEAARLYWRSLGSKEGDGFRFLQVSSDEVYGSLGHDEGAFSETSPYAPSSPYAATKASADLLVHAYQTTFGLPTLVTTCTNNHGPYQHPEKLVPLMVTNALAGESLPIYGDGANVREWLYVEDHCAALLSVLHDGRVGDKYNIGSGAERTNIEIIDAVCALLEEIAPARENPALGARGITSYSDLKTFVADRPGHDRRYAIDASKIRAELSWQPAHDFDAGLAKTVRWYVANRAWCEARTGATRPARAPG